MSTTEPRSRNRAKVRLQTKDGDFEYYPSHGDPPLTDTPVQRIEREALWWVLNRHLTGGDLYVGADLFVYYKEGNRDLKVSPDLFICLGVPRETSRRVYKTWEEGHGLDWVLEVVSKGTWRNDVREKREIYARRLGVQEYFVYDPEGRYLQQPLLHYRNEAGVLKLVEDADPMRQRSELLGLDLVIGPVVHPTAKWRLDFALPDGTRLLRSDEKVESETSAREAAEALRNAAEARAQQEADARRAAETRAQQEADARRAAETRVHQEADARRAAETQVQQEADARRAAEQEIQWLREQLRRQTEDGSM